MGRKGEQETIGRHLPAFHGNGQPHRQTDYFTISYQNRQTCLTDKGKAHNENPASAMPSRRCRQAGTASHAGRFCLPGFLHARPRKPSPEWRQGESAAFAWSKCRFRMVKTALSLNGNGTFVLRLSRCGLFAPTACCRQGAEIISSCRKVCLLTTEETGRQSSGKNHAMGLDGSEKNSVSAGEDIRMVLPLTGCTNSRYPAWRYRRAARVP